MAQKLGSSVDVNWSLQSCPQWSCDALNKSLVSCKLWQCWEVQRGLLALHCWPRWPPSFYNMEENVTNNCFLTGCQNSSCGSIQAWKKISSFHQICIIFKREYCTVLNLQPFSPDPLAFSPLMWLSLCQHLGQEVQPSPLPPAELALGAKIGSPRWATSPSITKLWLCIVGPSEAPMTALCMINCWPNSEPYGPSHFFLNLKFFQNCSLNRTFLHHEEEKAKWASSAHLLTVSTVHAWEDVLECRIHLALSFFFSQYHLTSFLKI